VRRGGGHALVTRLPARRVSPRRAVDITGATRRGDVRLGRAGPHAGFRLTAVDVVVHGVDTSADSGSRQRRARNVRAAQTVLTARRERSGGSCRDERMVYGRARKPGAAAEDGAAADSGTPWAGTA